LAQVHVAGVQPQGWLALHRQPAGSTAAFINLNIGGELTQDLFFKTLVKSALMDS
jgi:hypothetical protein